MVSSSFLRPFCALALTLCSAFHRPFSLSLPHTHTPCREEPALAPTRVRPTRAWAALGPSHRLSVPSPVPQAPGQGGFYLRSDPPRSHSGLEKLAAWDADLGSPKQEAGAGSGPRGSEEQEPEEEPGGAGRGLPRAATRWAGRPLELRAGARRRRREEQVPGWWCECPEDSAAFSGAWVWSPPFSPFLSSVLLSVRLPVYQGPFFC